MRTGKPKIEYCVVCDTEEAKKLRDNNSMTNIDLVQILQL